VNDFAFQKVKSTAIGGKQVGQRQAARLP